jgi:hypothetical protein
VSQQWLEYYKQQHSIFYTDSILSVAELKSQLESMPANTAGGRRLWLDQDIDILIGYLHSTGSVMIRHPSPNETSRERMASFVNLV